MVEKPQEEVGRVRTNLAWTAFAGLVHAHMVRADDEALAHGERLLRLYPAEVKAHEQAHAIVRDLQRRKKEGTFGKESAKTPPKDFDQLEVNKKIAYLIDSLQDVDARQDGQPGGVDLAGDFRVAALIKIGDAAVPALIDVLE